MRRLPPARRRAAAAPRPSRAVRRRRGPAIDAPCGSMTNSGTSRRPASRATRSVTPTENDVPMAMTSAHRVAGLEHRRATRSPDGCRSARRTTARAAASGRRRRRSAGRVAASGRASKARSRAMPPARSSSDSGHDASAQRARSIEPCTLIERPGAGGLVQQVDVLRDQLEARARGPRASARGRPARDGPGSAAPPRTCACRCRYHDHESAGSRWKCCERGAGHDVRRPDARRRRCRGRSGCRSPG